MNDLKLKRKEIKDENGDTIRLVGEKPMYSICKACDNAIDGELNELFAWQLPGVKGLKKRVGTDSTDRD